METIFVCPVCQSILKLEPIRYVCPNNHSFDIAREGYVNLLLANQKRSQQPGDNTAMIRNRRQFLDAGYYDPLRNSLSALVRQQVKNPDGIVLDVGCGEGFYTGAIQGLKCYGIDISKPAVRLAARRYPQVRFAVAGMKHLPVGNQQIDCLLSVFAPRSFPEFSRVLHPGGTLVVVTPGPEHLWSLRRLLYAEPQPHLNDASVPHEFALVAESRLYYEIELHTTGTISQLLSMTPYGWQAPQSGLQVVLKRENLKTLVDFSVHVYRKIVSAL